MLVLNKYDPRPIYQQVKENIKKQIVSGVLKPNDQLPSVRELATQLVINPNTIQRAYHELEAEGFIYKLAGKGTFVAQQNNIPPEACEKLLEEFSRVSSNLLFYGYGKDELIKMIKQLDREVNNDD